jgi:hypothetical protein
MFALQHEQRADGSQWAEQTRMMSGAVAQGIRWEQVWHHLLKRVNHENRVKTGKDEASSTCKLTPSECPPTGFCSGIGMQRPTATETQ